MTDQKQNEQVIGQTSLSQLIGEIRKGSDALLKDQYILGVFNGEYKNYTKETYAAFRDSGIVPSVESNHLRYAREYRAHFPSYEKTAKQYDRILAITNSSKLSEDEQIKQLIPVLESMKLDQKDQAIFNELLEREDNNAKQANKKAERQVILAATSAYVDKSLKALAAYKATSSTLAVDLSATTRTDIKLQQATDLRNTFVQIAAQPTSREFKQVIRAGLLQEPAIKMARAYNADNLEGAKKKANDYWGILVNKGHQSEDIIESLVKTVVSELDEFIKNEYLLKAFAKDFNTPSKTILNKTRKLINTSPETTFEQDFMGKETNFSFYKEKFFTPQTNLYLMSVYPNEFLAFRQMVNLLDEIVGIQANKALTQKERLRKIFECFSRFSQSDWVVDVDIRKYIPQNPHHLLNVNALVEKFSDTERSEKAGANVIGGMNTLLRELNAKLAAKCKAAEISQSASVVIQREKTPPAAPIYKSAPATVERKPEQHQNYSTGQKLFTPPVSPVASRQQSIYGKDLLGKAAQWATNLWNGSANQDNEKNRPASPRQGRK